MEFLKSDGHGGEAHGLGPDLCNDLVDDHGCCFEEF